LQGIQHPNTFNKAPINTQTFEFKYLDDSINEMMQKVQDAFQLERDFIMNVSHELLTPISILQNKIENCMSDGQMDDETAMKLVEMQKTLLRLTKVVKALLYISKIDNEQFLKNEIVDLKLSVAEVLLELEDKIEQKNLTITMDWEIEALLLHESNKTLIHTLFFNIISNALKYNVRDGKINITAHKQDDFIVVTVKDTGCGIEEKNLSQIFERFKRFRPDDENSYGIGLPIVKKIATFLNLELKVASQLGVGTIFSIYFSSKLLKLKG
jgi:signal transduction histidine kinase